MISRRVYAVLLDLEFPNGLAPGDGGDFNTLMLARNGKQQPVLRGTTLAGVLRSEWRCVLLSNIGKDDTEKDLRETLERRYFGYVTPSADARIDGIERAVFIDGSSSESTYESVIKVNDSVLRTEPKLSPDGGCVQVRTHHLRIRHSGSVADQALFSMETCPPGTTARIVLWIFAPEDAPETSNVYPLDLKLHPKAEHDWGTRRFLDATVLMFQRGIILGGKSARGVGFGRAPGDILCKEYTLTDPEQYAQLLDDQRQLRINSSQTPDGFQCHKEESEFAKRETLEVTLSFGIPRGQDVLVGDGQGNDYEIEPQRVVTADEKIRWRLPGSSVRGILRAWMTRLAEKDLRSKGPITNKYGKQFDHVADSSHLEKKRREGTARDYEEFRGDNFGWGFAGKEIKDIPCPIMQLFGSLARPGRIHITDGLAEASKPKADSNYQEEQLRMHVAVDRITGGAAESMLFDNTVLTALPTGRSPQFNIAIRIEDPEEYEVDWIARTIKALDVGVLRVGSSKSSGRLSLMAVPIVNDHELAGPLNSIEPFLTPDDFETPKVAL